MKNKQYVSWICIFALVFGVFFNSISTKRVESSGTVTVKIHYHREDGQYDPWNLWIWPEGGEGQAYHFTEDDKFGKVATVTLPVDVQRVGFIVRTDEWEKDVGDDRFIEISGGSGEIWVYSGKPEFLTEAPAGYEVEIPQFEKIDLTFHYFRYDEDYAGWMVQLWKEGEERITLQDILFKGKDQYGEIATVTLEEMKDVKKVGFIISKDGEEKDIDEERFISLARVDEKGRIEVYIMQGEAKIGYRESDIDRIPTIKKAAIESIRELNVQVNVPFTLTDPYGGFVLKSQDKELEVQSIEAMDILQDGYTRDIKIIPKEDFDLGCEYSLAKEGYGEVSVVLGNLFGSQDFEDQFHYDGEDLGAIYTKDRTQFRLWAPTASKVNLLLYQDGHKGELEKTISMKKDVQGTWITILDGDQKGKFYTYEVTVGDQVNEGTDPYAKAVGVNGKRAMVVDLSGTNPKGWASDTKPEYTNFEDAIIYELHVRDLSMHKDSGIQNKGKFLGLIEKETKTPDGEMTGLDHMIDLGITHLHLLPVFDFRTIDETRLQDNDFNWGYDPQNYNVPEGSYATDPYSGTVRIQEFKEMVQALHKNDIRVIMDVVYNHTGLTANSHLNLLVPNYYYRLNEDGSFCNGSGCGNEIASERSMVRKMIVDSVIYWAKEYHIDGFRFDLMGLHDIETMNEIRRELDKIDPTILVYGEGWTAGTSPLPDEQKALKANVGLLQGIAAFSDNIRDGIKGSVFEEAEPGFANGALGKEESVKFGIVGATQHPQVDYSKVNYSKEAWATDPAQSINYVAAHDNHTLWDKFKKTNPKESDEERIKMHKLSNAIVFTSQGIPFLHAGEEILRTKFGDENSYKSPDAINRIDWSKKSRYKDVYEYYKGLIALRKAHPAFRMTTAEDIQKNLSFMDMPVDNMVGYTLNNHANGDSLQTMIILFNANPEDYEVMLPKENWGVLVNGEKAGTEILEHVLEDRIIVPARSALVLGDGESLGLTVEARMSKVDSTTEPSKNRFKIIGWLGIAVVAFGGGFYWISRKKVKGKKKR